MITGSTCWKKGERHEEVEMSVLVRKGGSATTQGVLSQSYLWVETVAELGDAARNLVKMDGFMPTATLDDIHRHCCAVFCWPKEGRGEQQDVVAFAGGCEGVVCDRLLARQF
jgi:hypothetical protein